MTTPPPDVDLTPVVIPDAINAPDADAFLEMVRVRTAIARERTGNDDDVVDPGQLLASFAPSPDETRLLWTIRRGGEAIGRVGVDIPWEEGARAAYWFLEILREHQGAGYASAAYDAVVERTAAAHGRRVVQAWYDHVPSDGPQLESPTGFGRVPRDRNARFCLRHGYTLEQVERRSELDLRSTRDHVDALLADATQAADGYRIVQWEAPTPARYAADYAWMKSRMSTDAPSAGMDTAEEAWDGARVERHDRSAVDGGGIRLVTAAEHLDSGRLVAFNELGIGPDLAQASGQEDTLVLREHRGHRLGMLVKCAGLAAWRDRVPDSPKVITYNAEENRAMLDINEAIGFVPVGYESAWRKDLSADAGSAGRGDSSGS